MFTADTRGDGGSAARSSCDPQCQEDWPPVVTEAAPTASGGADESLVGTIPIQANSRHVTYNGWPLYYYTGDEAGAAPAGHDDRSFGGEWYLVAPDGEPIGHDG